MTSVVEKWGDGAAVGLPVAVMEAADVRLGQQVGVRAECGRIVVVPVLSVRYEIGSRVAAITDQNRHDPLDMGLAVGQEIF